MAKEIDKIREEFYRKFRNVNELPRFTGISVNSLVLDTMSLDLMWSWIETKLKEKEDYSYSKSELKAMSERSIRELLVDTADTIREFQTLKDWIIAELRSRDNLLLKKGEGNE